VIDLSARTMRHGSSLTRSRAVERSMASGEIRARPFVKWAGGKTQLLDELMKRIPRKYSRYYEPFAGGAALFFHLAPARSVLADTNGDLLATYGVVRDDVEVLIRKLGRYATAHCARLYHATRDRWNAGRIKAGASRAAAFIYLNKTCFNGLWRVNRTGAFNVPIGRYTDPPICVPAALRAAQVVLARAELRHADYRDAVIDASRGDFIYFDPPYDPVTPTANFTSYTVGGFSREDQRELAQTVRELIARGCHVVLSNSDTPFVRSLYHGFKIDRVKCARSINTNVRRRGCVNELIITGASKK
jgi:DNA adenine methylase